MWFSWEDRFVGEKYQSRMEGIGRIFTAVRRSATDRAGVDSESAPATKAVFPSLVAIVGAGLAIAGAIIVHRRGAAGHALLAAGVVAFLTGSRLAPIATQRPTVAKAHAASRVPTAGLVLLALADGACIAGFSDRLVVGGWLAGFAVLGIGIVLSRLRAFRPPAFSRSPSIAATAVLVAVAAVADLHRLEDFPPAVHGDVGEIALAALGMDLPRDLFRTTSWWSMPGMHNALQRLGFLFADGLGGARATDAWLGVLSVVPLAAIVRRAVGLRAAVVGGLLAIGSANMVNTWRLGVGLGPPPFLALVALWAFVRAMTTSHSPRDFFLVAGIAAGLSVQVNLAARVIPIILACFAVHELVFGSGEGRRRMLAGFGWTVAAALVIAGPLLWRYVESPELLQPRSDKFVLSEPTLRHSQRVYGTDSALGVLGHQAVRSFGMFHYYSEGEDVGFFIGEGGFFEPLTAALFLLGVATGLSGFRDRRFGWPVVGCVISVLLLAATIHPPSYHRAGPAAAFALVLVGLACGALFDAIERLAVAAGLGRTRAAVAANAAAVLIAVAGVALGMRTYFLDYCRRQWKMTDSTEIARRIAAEPAARSFTYLLAAPVFGLGYGNIRFLARDHRGMDLAPAAPMSAATLAPGVNLFIALPHRAAELEALAARLPGGTWERHAKKSPPDALEFLVLRIETPERAVPP
ncbi:MAG: hypothetical protein ACREQQ_06985 [Candidatus Binatia bacterium]